MIILTQQKEKHESTTKPQKLLKTPNPKAYRLRAYDHNEYKGNHNLNEKKKGAKEDKNLRLLYAEISNHASINSPLSVKQLS